MSVAAEIAAGRRAARLDASTFASLAELTEERLVAIEAGAEAEPAEVDRCVRVLGLRPRDLLAGEARRSPMAVLLRSAREEGRSAVEAIAETGAIEGIGDFHRAVRDLAYLEARIGSAVVPMPTGYRYPGDPEREAKSLRLRAGLDLTPIPSMRAWLSSLGVSLFFTTPEELDRDIDGASTTVPRPAILVNLVGGAECWWRTRMTLAHELAHLLFDLDTRRTLFSPHIPPRGRRAVLGRWRLFDGFDDIETHADAFAACLLAPGEAVRDVVGALAPTSEEAIARVGSRFGVGRSVAINRLRDVFRLSVEERAEMERRASPPRYPAAFEGDCVREGVGLREGLLKAHVAEALRRGVLQRSRAHEILGVPLTAPLPLDGVDDAVTRPLVSAEQRLLVAAQQHLARLFPCEALQATRVVAEGDHWVVEVRREGDGPVETERVGTLTLDDRGEVCASDLALA